MTWFRRKFTARRAALTALLATCALFSLPAFAQEAVALVPGTPVNGTLTEDVPLVTYSFDGEVGTYDLFLESDYAQTIVVQVVDATGLSIIAEAVGADNAISATALVSSAGTHYVVVSSATAVVGTPVDYDLTLTALDAATAIPTPAVTEGAETPVPGGTATNGTGQVVTTSGFSIALSWTGAADLDLEVRDPVGGSLYWETPSVESGGTISPNINQGCANVNSDTPSETATWSPGGIPTGSYEVLVYYQQACAGDAPISFSLDATLDGTSLQAINASVTPSQVFVSRIIVSADGSADAEAGGVVILDDVPFAFADVQAAAQPIEIETTSSGFIGNEQPFVAYSFEGQANEILSVNLTAINGSLDTFVAVLDANGNVVSFNDDAAPGVTDSLISGLLLPAAGQYYVVATRYAKDEGGTEGNFDLLVTQQTVNLSEEFLSLPEGSLEVLLLWNTAADLQLLVRDPAGDSVFDDIPRITSGGVLAALGNVNCRVSDGTPFSYIYWPPERQPRTGSYEVEVWFQNECNDPSPVTFNLYVTLNGRQIFHASESPVLDERYLTSFTINADGSTTPSDGGIIRGLDTLDYQPEVTSAPPVASGEQTAGSITPTNKFDVYSYDGVANSNVTITLNATSGTLDTTLYLVSPSGQLIAQNDDAVPGENTNSLIADFTLPEDGQYIIIVTHYGALYGGTTGTYTLTLTELS